MAPEMALVVILCFLVIIWWALHPLLELHRK